MALTDIAATIITKDAESTLAKTLESLRDLPEVVVYDNGSTDGTVALAREFENVTVHEGPFFGFGKTFNHAMDLATRDWVLVIDADEVVTPELMASMAKADLSDPDRGYVVHRHNYFLGKYVRWGGFGNDFLIRLCHRKEFRHTEEDVHPRIYGREGSRTERIDGPLLHDSVRDLTEYVGRVNSYTELRRRGATRSKPVPVIVLRAMVAFFRSYFLQLGILAGWRGVIISFVWTEQTFWKYMKVYADHHR
jgi:glycosyltransferase involved in cell wall biosynthesis